MQRLLRRPLLLGAAVLVLGAAGTVAGLYAARHDRSAAASPTSEPVKPLQLMSTTPASGAQAVAPDSTLTVVFNQPVADYSTLPTLSPPVNGTWVPDGPTALEFQANQGLPPGASETIDVPGGDGGVVASDGAHLVSSTSSTFTVAPMSILRTQELLAQLNYLPLSFTAVDDSAVPIDQMALDQEGTFDWRWSTLPAALTSLWNPGQPNVVTTGAVMAFESQQGLKTDGEAGPQVWNALISAVSAKQSDDDPNYDWVQVSTSIPESVTVWRNGSPVYSTPANTGIEAAATEEGTWPVYARYTSTTMKGTNPDGTTYDDPGVPWVSYFHGGDALHGFVRASYGTPQSLGCVEMPPANAGIVFPLTPLGTLVTIG